MMGNANAHNLAHHVQHQHPASVTIDHFLGVVLNHTSDLLPAAYPLGFEASAIGAKEFRLRIQKLSVEPKR